MKTTRDSLIAHGWLPQPDGSYAKQTDPKCQAKPSKAVEREADLHAQILAHCRSHGWPVVHSRMDVPQTAGIGTPDFVIALYNGATAWIEAKAGNGKLRPEQQAWIEALRAQGHRAGVVRSFPEFLAVVGGDP